MLVVKNLPANSGDARDVGSIPGLVRSLGEGSGNPLQYSFFFSTQVFLPGNFLGQRSLASYSPRGHKESDMTEHTHTYTQNSKHLDYFYIFFFQFH